MSFSIEIWGGRTLLVRLDRYEQSISFHHWDGLLLRVAIKRTWRRGDDYSDLPAGLGSLG